MQSSQTKRLSPAKVPVSTSGEVMELRRDERGRPIGLDWPAAPEFTPEQVKRTVSNASLENLQKGRQPLEMCEAGLHSMKEFGKKRSDNDGSYCTACKATKSKRWQDNNKEKAREYRRRYREKKKREREAAASQTDSLAS